MDTPDISGTPITYISGVRRLKPNTMPIKEFKNLDGIVLALAPILEPGIVQKALACYQEPWRKYHGLAHITDLFGFAQKHGFSLNSAQTLALLFHDAVYMPGAPAGRNERASAELMDQACLHVAFDVRNRARSIILDTVRHIPRSVDSPLVLDPDLSPFIEAAQGRLNKIAAHSPTTAPERAFSRGSSGELLTFRKPGLESLTEYC